MPEAWLDVCFALRTNRDDLVEALLKIYKSNKLALEEAAGISLDTDNPQVSDMDDECISELLNAIYSLHFKEQAEFEIKDGDSFEDEKISHSKKKQKKAQDTYICLSSIEQEKVSLCAWSRSERNSVLPVPTSKDHKVVFNKLVEAMEMPHLRDKSGWFAFVHDSN